MKCPHCGWVGVSHVTETRQTEDAIYRRRPCSNCGKRVITVEQVAPDNQMPSRTVAARKARMRITLFSTPPGLNWKAPATKEPE